MSWDSTGRRASDNLPVSLKGALRPFSARRSDAVAPAGGTILDCLKAAGWGWLLDCPGQVRVLLRGGIVPREMWGRVRPQPGDIVNVRVVPASGGGGGGGKDPMATVLTLAVVAAAVAAPYLAPASMGLLTAEGGLTLAGAMASAGIMAGGTMLVNAISPPQMPKFSGGSGRANFQAGSSPTYSIQGARNSERKYGPIPKIFGRHRVWPGFGAKPYTEIIGDDEYLRLLFVVGYGRLQLSEHKIGETLLSSFSGYEINVRDGQAGQGGFSIYPNQVTQDTINLPLTYAGGWQARTTQADTDEIGFDVYFPQLFQVFTEDNQDYLDLKAAGRDVQVGDYWETDVSFDVEYRPVGGSWTSWGSYTITANSRTPIRRGWRKAVTSGQYEVRWRRTSADDATGYVYDTFAVTALRSFTYGSPVVEPAPLCTVEIRIKATDQLTGVIDQYNCIAESYLPVWDGASWADAVTRSPAWAYAEVLRGAGNKRAIADSRLDADAIKTWADNCAAAGWHFDAVIDAQTTVFEMLREIASAGRAAFSIVDNQYSIVEDKARTTPVQMITPRNSWGYEGRKLFPNPKPHAIRARFVNADAGYQQDERIVYDDGYDAASATVFETCDVFGITDTNEVWKHVRYRIAASRLRPEFHSVWLDIENLVATRGDLVIFQHDVPMIGVGNAARISALTESGGEVFAVTCDDVFPLEAGTSYLVKIRCADNTYRTAYVDATADGETDTLTFREAISSGTLPEAGDLVALYETATEEALMLVASIEPGPDMTAKLTMVDYHAGVYTADTGTIPAWTSNITRPPNYAVSGPPRPAIDDVASDETVLALRKDGTLQTRIEVRFSWEPGDWAGEPSFQLQYRLSDGGEWRSMPYLPKEARVAHAWPVEERMEYDVRLRAVGQSGAASDWSMVEGHAVVGKSSPPPDVEILQMEPGVLVWRYDSPPLDLAGFEVRYHYGANRSWSSATPAHGRVVTTRRFNLDSRFSGTVTFLVKAKDTSGNYSETAAVLVKDLGDALTDNVVNTYSYAPDFAGTASGCSIVGGALKADDLTTMWSGDSTAMWNADPTTGMWSSSYSEMSYEFTFTPDSTEAGGNLLLATTLEGDGIAISYRDSGAFPMWTAGNAAMWSDDAAGMWSAIGWLDWPGRLDGIGLAALGFRIAIQAGATRGVISGCDVVVDMDDVAESFQDVAVDAAGTRLSITESYRAIKNVLLTLQDDGGSAVTARAMDKDATDGPLIKCFDASGTAVAGTVDAQIQGY